MASSLQQLAHPAGVRSPLAGARYACHQYHIWLCASGRRELVARCHGASCLGTSPTDRHALAAFTLKDPCSLLQSKVGKHIACTANTHQF